jgi:demethylmenaquinone methyltransferase/2-methoxy-6-polyprenyl-1,4-benzoquinol methylase
MAAPPGPEVQAMFGEIAPRYDLLNRLLSFGVDRSWRKRTVRSLAPGPGQRLLDLCCGTGDLALELRATGAEVHGADFTAPMLSLAFAKALRTEQDTAWVRADAQALPYADASFDAVTIAFGIRNVADPRRALAECRRVLRPGGRLAVLEFFPVRNRLWRALFRLYFVGILPRIARLFRVGRGGAYAYLPASVDAFPRHEVFADWMRAVGFPQVSDRPLTGGVARLLVGTAEEA